MIGKLMLPMGFSRREVAMSTWCRRTAPIMSPRILIMFVGSPMDRLCCLTETHRTASLRGRVQTLARVFHLYMIGGFPMFGNKYYRSEDGSHLFKFGFVPQDGFIEVYCKLHPSLNGRDPDPHKTHLFSSGKLCFVSGREPRDQSRAEELAKQWAEYFLQYRRTGIAQS
jgi:hypothetical protein